MGKNKKIKNKRQLQGIVVKDKMSKTIVAIVTVMKLHPKYLKRYKVSKKYKIHDELNSAHIGDTVIFEECRPISKDKKWRLIKILKKNK